MWLITTWEPIKLEMVDINNPEQMAWVMSNVSVLMDWTTEQVADLMLSKREECIKRGYHMVSEDEEDPLICEHCGLWFWKDDDFVDYRITREEQSK